MGIFGVHNFYMGRRIRGWIMLGCMLAFLVWFFVQDTFFDATHPWMGMNVGDSISPFVLLSTVSLVLWVSDIFGIVFGWYKYPVRLGEVSDAGKIRAK